LGKAILLNDPERQLRLGYSLVRAGGKIVKSVKGISQGDKIEIKLGDGSLESTVEGVKHLQIHDFLLDDSY
jgi:exonuclease VII large subunit